MIPAIVAVAAFLAAAGLVAHDEWAASTDESHTPTA